MDTYVIFSASMWTSAGQQWQVPMHRHDLSFIKCAIRRACYVVDHCHDSNNLKTQKRQNCRVHFIYKKKQRWLSKYLAVLIPVGPAPLGVPYIYPAAVRCLS
ncbi:hypothetical protein K439DRAFT_306225 [Ramaria rubella]|nr:hypothetical protein K439DRAFT_306225 [Ramaria rubella]